MRTLLLGAFFCLSFSIYADEGMWLLNAPPLERLEKTYGFKPTPQWLEKVQKSSVRFNNGGSGSFFSKNGLVVTNHHVGADCLQKLGTEKKNYLKNGFYAPKMAAELRCPDLELNVLMSIEDVTSQVNGSVQPQMTPEQAFEARRALMAKIEQDSLQKTGLRSDVVTLFQGGAYHLYQYKKYTDVRVVMAPEQQIAFFGGDPDNFEYPRYDLDVAFFRAYENGKPAQPAQHFKWNPEGVKNEELIFVSGHPGSTSRLLTVSELAYKRDRQLPFSLENIRRLESLYASYSARNDENARIAKSSLFSIQNARKVRTGALAALLSPEIQERKAKEEVALRAAVASRPQWQSVLQDFNKIETAQKIIAEIALPYNLLEGAIGFNSELFGIARVLLRSSQERGKPSGERLREYRDSNKESLELSLFSEEPIYNEFEILKLADSLTYLVNKMGFQDPFVQQVLAGRSPQERAEQLVKETAIKTISARKQLYAQDLQSVEASKDPMIQLALLIDQRARSLRKVIEEQEEVKKQAYGRIAAAQFALFSQNNYPDATFTLRLAYGAVRGYQEGERPVSFDTTIAGLYERSLQHNDKPPFDLPRSWAKAKGRLKLSTQMNFVSTADIIGGNSGSPTLNKNAEVVGIIFDGNIYSLVADYMYNDKQARALSVSTAVVTEALRKVYNAEGLVAELIKG